MNSQKLGKQWSTDDIEKVRNLANSHTSGEISRIIGRSVRSVNQTAQKHKIRFTSPKAKSHYNGRRAELFALRLFPNAHWISNVSPSSPYDLLLGSLRVNVKSSLLTMDQSRSRWRFRVGDYKDACDFFLLLAYRSESEFPVHAWYLPSHKCKASVIKVSDNSKSKWLDKYEMELMSN
ncbi:MAG: hypothetical protein K0Q73_7685 [Paenibacillus sp.]|jgi:hypothetical protein|nr:hypothetical protein [Paenibacillus sp.]